MDGLWSEQQQVSVPRNIIDHKMGQRFIHIFSSNNEESVLLTPPNLEDIPGQVFLYLKL